MNILKFQSLATVVRVAVKYTGLLKSRSNFFFVWSFMCGNKIEGSKNNDGTV